MRGGLAALPAAVVGVLLVLVLHTFGHLLHAGWMIALVWLAPAVAGAVYLRRRGGGDASSRRVSAPLWVLAGFLLLYLFSSAGNDGWFYFLAWPPVGGLKTRLLSWGGAHLAMLALLLTPLLLWRRFRITWMLSAVVAFSMAACVLKLWGETHGAPLYRDDHPSFLFRLWAFRQVFPSLVFYDPFWNGGNVSTHLLSSGTLSAGTLLWPFLKVMPVERLYTPAVALMFCVLVPAIAFASVRLVGGSVTAALCGAVLSLGVNQAHFLWLLHFGTLGGCFASVFVMLIAACVFRALWRDGRELWNGALLVIASFLLLAWPPSAFTAAALLLAAVASLRRGMGRSVLFLAACAAVAAVLYLPQAMALFRLRDPVGFATQGAEAMPWGEFLGKGWETLREVMRQGHPVLLFLGFGGVWFLRDRGVRPMFGALMLALALVSGWGEQAAPSLQLTRASIPLFYAAVVPASLCAGRLLEDTGVLRAPARALLVAVLVLGGWNSARFYGNGGPGKYNAIPDRIRAFAGWLREHTPEQGRILFAGATVHAYGKGHVAFLPVLSGRQMMACDYYHFSPHRVEYEYPPAAFRHSAEDVMSFIDVYNVTHVVTYHPLWIRFMKNRPEHFREVYSFGGARQKLVFEVHRPASFLQGARGEVTAGFNELHVRLHEPADRLVLKYNWVDGLVTDPPNDLEPWEGPHGVRLIEVRPWGKMDFRIRYRGPER